MAVADEVGAEDEIAGRLGAVRATIAAACARSGRAGDAVTLVLASKTQPAAAIAAAYAAGAREFGENYVQEAIAKRAATAHLGGLRWHLIGHLQSNKARAAVASFALIHTLDSERLAVAIARVRPAPPQEVLIEVNMGGEASKHGVRPAAAERLIAAVRDRVAVRGLMTIPPPEAAAASARRWFGELRELRDRLAGATGLALSELSMGMSGDYAAAIAEGATIVRVGRAIFGERSG
ncbi:MAG: YggS family pyridoxal phosphate-dependent enzyme [Candidatus Binataceae bacterium]|nr:YggS family pyridoxal phosphate-dependent enzyme [Candidatus Binataceae bacterium]